MNPLCDTCTLRNNIEGHRVMLNDLLVQKNNKLLDKEIISQSQVLDVLIYKCIFCNKNLGDILKFNLKNIFGTHTSFYYYGHQHLFSSMYFYIIEGINNKELIYISMEQDLYNKLLFFLEINNVPLEHIKYKNVRELIMCNRQGGVPKLKEVLLNNCLECEVEKYSGIRWIGQPTFAIQTTSQNDFLHFETSLSEALNNTNASLLCIYDAYDYMNKSEYINETVIKQSLNTHSYVLNNLVLEKIN